jgi:hypothetical protein
MELETFFEDKMIADLATESVKILQDEFYSKRFEFSYSSLNKLLWNPVVFHQLYVLKMKEEKTDAHLVHGKIIHALLLEENKFNDLFIISPGVLPTGNIKLVIDRVFVHHIELEKNGDQRDKLEDFDQAILDVLKDINLHQSLKTDEQRIAKICTPDSLIYWKFMLDSFGKQIVDPEMFKKCSEIVEKVKLNPEISALLKLNHGSEWWSTVEVMNETAMSIDLKKYKFGLKGVIDNLVIDPIDKVIKINDFKTSSKTLVDFPESVKFYKYSLQAAVYYLLVANKYSDLLAQNYRIEFRFIVVDKNQQVYPFLVTDDTMKQWTKELQEALQVADYHYTNKQYTLPYSFVTGEVKL